MKKEKGGETKGSTERLEYESSFKLTYNKTFELQLLQKALKLSTL